MVIRWLGAYGKGKSLADSLSWELSQTERKVLSAEKLSKGHSRIGCLVGLLTTNKAVVRRYNSDVYTVKKGHAMRATRPEGISTYHTEYLIRPCYKAIVVKYSRYQKISKQALQACLETSKTYNLPILYLSKGGKLHPYQR